MIRLVIALVVLLGLAAAPAAAQPARPPVLQGIGLEEHLGARIPLDLPFSEAAGRRVRLGEFFGDGKPVVMVLAYVRCKMLCSLVLQTTTAAVRAMPLTPGRDYRLITVSIDPDEESAAAAVRRAELVARLGRPGAADRWTYLVGAEHPIRALADALGFHYRWDPRTEQFAHPAVITVLTPDGTIARYFQGIDVAPAELAGALKSAAAGQVAQQSLAETVLSCFRFDPAARAHRAQIDRYLQIGGAVIAALLGGSLLGLYRWERRRRSQP